MRLFHGTSGRVARLIAAGEALRSGKPTHWSEELKPALGHVYLTTTWPLVYAAHTRQDEWGVLEIDPRVLEPERLRPDEDWVAEHLLDARHDLSDRLCWARENLATLARYWPQSLAELGCVAYAGELPRETFLRAVVVEPLPEYDRVAANAAAFARDGAYHRANTYRVLESGTRLFGV